MSGPALIGLDWGTTSFRAFRIGADGAVLERREAPAGILQVQDDGFEAVLEREIGDWRRVAPGCPIVASGMITSRQGWVEVPYLHCPAGAHELAAALHPHRLREGELVHFVPGLSREDEEGVPDVIRGEETQIAGLTAGRSTDPDRDVLAVLPGTHSKWAGVEGGRIVWFETYLTGEVFGVLRLHSILGRLMEGDGHDRDAFRRGLAYAGEGGAGLLRRLFSARTLGLFDRLPTSGGASYLSGLLIGTEVAEAIARRPLPTAPVQVIGGSRLVDHYLEALAACDIEAVRAPDDAAARGHVVIARCAGLMP
jgi:2-dehydro-3-deoxygalactonokinase